MSNSSQRPNYSTISITDLTTNSDTITIGGSTDYYSNNDSLMYSADTLTIDIGDITVPSLSTITISGGGSSGGYYVPNNSNYITDFNFNVNTEEWVDGFPDWDRIQKMCEKYPSLEIALRNFRTIYTLVKDDYDTPKNED